MTTINPYDAPQSEVARPQQTTHALPLAGRGIRLLAAVLDTILLGVILAPWMVLSGYFDEIMRGGDVSYAKEALWTVIGFVVFVVVQGIPLSGNGQTWGKRMVGIRIVDQKGNRPSPARLLGLRYLPLHAIYLIPLIAPILVVIDALFIFRRDRRCVHDLIAGTQVVKD